MRLRACGARAVRRLFDLLKSGTFGRLLVVEAVLLLGLAAVSLRAPVRKEIAGDELYTWGECAFTETETGITVSASDPEGSWSGPVLQTRLGSLRAGAYDLRIRYSAEDLPVVDEAGEAYAAGSVTVESASNTGILFGKADLSVGVTELRTRLFLKMGYRHEAVEVTIWYAGSGKLTVESVELEEITAWRVLRILCAAVIFALIDAVVALMNGSLARRFGRRRVQTLVICAALIGFASLLCFADFLPLQLLGCGHDLQFHLARIVSLAEAIEDGQLPQRIQTGLNNGYGHAAPLFYGELFLYLPALLYGMGMPLQTAYQIYVVCVQMLTCICAYAGLMLVFKSRRLCLFGTALYMLSSYRLNVVYLRAAVGEYTAMAFYPLIFCGFYAIFAKRDEDVRLADGLPLVIGFSGVLQSHMLSCEMIALFTVPVLLVLWKKTFSRRRFGTLALSAGMILLLNLWFIVPFAESMSMDIVLKRVTNHIEGTGAYLWQILGLTSSASGFSTLFGVTGEMPLSIGLSLTASVALFFVQWLQRDRALDAQNKGARTTAILCAVSLAFSSAYFPWGMLCGLSDALGRIFGMVQFCWRYLALASFFAVVLGVFGVSMLEGSAGRKAALAAMGVLTAIALLTAGELMGGIAHENESQHIYAQSDLRSMDGVDTQYLLSNASKKSFNNRTAGRSDACKNVERKGASLLIEVSNDAEQEIKVTLPVVAYDHYRVTDCATGEILPYDSGKQCCIRVTLPAGFVGRLSVVYAEPLHWRICEGISLVTLLGLCVGRGLKRRAR